MRRGQRLCCTTTLAVCLAVLFGAHAAAGQDDGDPDGLVHVELTLRGRAVRVAYDASLPADAPSLAALMAAAPDTADAAVRLGHLEGHRSLRIGSLGPEPADPPPPSPPTSPDHDLWLMRTTDGWEIEARPVIADAEDAADAAETPDTADTADTEDPPEPAGPVRIPLTYTQRSESSPLSAALVPNRSDGGTLGLIWGAHYWTADFAFIELESRPRPERTSNVGRPSSLTRDSDTSGRARAARLGTRNETALVTPAGARIQVLFHRGIDADADDFAGIDAIGDGDVLTLSRAAVIRLRTETPLHFGDTLVPTGNLAPDFPGAYGLWLKKVGTQWRLVFNNEPDSWGTQYDPAFDAAEVDLRHAQDAPTDAERPLAVYLVPRDDDAAGLIIHWGRHTWNTGFGWTP